MSDTTIEPRALPTTYALFRQYLPAQPSDTTAAKLLQALHRLDELIGTTVHQLEQVDLDDRALAAELAGIAVDPAAPLPSLTKLDTNIRGGLEHRLAVLRMARDIAAHRHTQADLSDPALIRWREQCREREHEWRQLMSLEDEQARFTVLADFATRHARH